MKYNNCLMKTNQVRVYFNKNVLQNHLQTLRCLTTSTIGDGGGNKTKNHLAENASTNFAQEWQQAKPFEDIPTMTPFKLLRNFLPGGKYSKLDSVQMIMALKVELGPIGKITGILGRPDTVLTHNPDDFEKVFRTEGIWPVRLGSEGLCHHRRVLRADFFQGVEGLLGTQGEQWSAFRSVVNPVLLQPKNVRLYLNKMSQVNKQFLQRIVEIRNPTTFEVPANFEEELNRWALESISVVALDKQLGLLTENRDNAEVKKLFGLLTDFFTYSVDVEYKPAIWKYYKTKSFNKLMATLDGITDITSKYVQEAVERIEQDRRNGVAEKAESEQSVLEKLIKIDKKIAMVMAMDMLMAGVDTTTSAFTGLLLCLARNPEKQSTLRLEVMSVLPRKDSEFDEVTFKNMPFLRACIKEALRMYPLVVGTARLPVTDVVLSGYRVPKGTQVSIITESLLSSDAYYERANEFLPERWLRYTNDKEEQETRSVTGCPHALKSINPFIYLPFGFGPRSCVGRRIAELEMEVGIARLVRNFHIEFNHPTENAFKSLFIKVPNIPLTFKFTDLEY